MSPDNQRRRVWRRPGQRCDTNLTIFRQTGRQPGVRVWGVISFHSRAPLVVIRRNLTAQRCVDEVLRPLVLSFMSRNPVHIFQQDNARPTLHMFLLLVLVVAEHYLGPQGRRISLLLSTSGVLWPGPSNQLRILTI